MSIRLMSDVWELPLKDSEKLILLALADFANDEGVCWPSIATLVRRSGKSERTVQSSIKHLVDAGYLKRDEVRGKGCYYTVNPRKDCTPAATAPPQPLRDTPAAVAPKPSRTTSSERTNVLSSVRATRLPADWSLPNDWRQWTVEQFPHWPPGMIDDQAARFADYWQAKAGTMGRKTDWRATWRNWTRTANDRSPQAKLQRPRRRDISAELMAEAAELYESERRASGGDCGIEHALPAPEWG